MDCIRAVREHSPKTRIEVLVPDFRGRMERALEIMHAAPPDVFNHNLESVPRLYKKCATEQITLGLWNYWKNSKPHILMF